MTVKWKLPKLPDNWHYKKGLEYPTTVFYKGEPLVMEDYLQHHLLVKEAFSKDIAEQKAYNKHILSIK
jgi:hypothetical protein